MAKVLELQLLYSPRVFVSGTLEAPQVMTREVNISDVFTAFVCLLQQTDGKWGSSSQPRFCVDGTGDRSKVPCYKEQYCIGTWNVRSMNRGKLEVVKQKMARVNVDILGISELK